MNRLQSLHIGIVGACGRGSSLSAALAHRQDRVTVQAVCDADAGGLPEAQSRFGATAAFTDLDDMLGAGALDAVFIATPMHLHAAQSIQALDAGVHVLCEVTPAISVDECRQLVSCVRASQAQYMLAENCNFTRQSLLIAELVRAGHFGETYYVEAEYLHEVRGLNERTPWRRTWQTGVDGITYGTHALGPALDWMPGQRVTRVCCAGSGHHYTDPRGAPYHQDTHVMLGQTSGGGLVKIRVDMLSTRPSVTTTYQLQGTRGCFESARRADEDDRIWLEGVHEAPSDWGRLAEMEEDHLPAHWKSLLAEGAGGHGGSDLLMGVAFLDALLDGEPVPVDVDRAMDMSLPGLISQQSMAQEGAWVDVPDSRDWTSTEGAGS